jgi:hypothetical protein
MTDVDRARVEQVAHRVLQALDSVGGVERAWVVAIMVATAAIAGGPAGRETDRLEWIVHRALELMETAVAVGPATTTTH